MNRRIFLFFFVAGFWSCSSHLDPEIDCSSLQVKLKSTTSPTICSPPNGAIRVYALGGMPPYSFRLNDSDFQNDSLFIQLPGGQYQVQVMDAFECQSSVEVSVTNFNTDLTASFETTPDTDCLTGNGSARFTPGGGTPPYQLKFKNTIVENTFEIQGLKNGIHQISVVDAQLCEFVLAVAIDKGKTTTRWSVDIKPIIDTRCAKPICHVAGTGRADLSKLENVQLLASQIKAKTQNGSMPFDAPMPASEIQLITCWVDDGALNN